MQRASLVKAGIALSPESFSLAMDAEEAVVSARVGQDSIVQVAEKVKRYKKGLEKIEGHLTISPHENGKERYDDLSVITVNFIYLTMIVSDY